MSDSQARIKLLDAARDLFLSKGYSAATVDEICERARASKGSFYHFFKSKEAMGLAVLDGYMQQAQTKFLDGKFTGKSDPKARLRGFLEQTEASATELWKNGCLLGNLAVDLADTNERIRKRVAKIFDQLTAGVAAIFEPACADYAAEPKAEAWRLAELYLATIEGAIILSRAHNDWTPLNRSLAGFRTHMEAHMK
jgi:TetR/AcrR family transcriptional repressor of nem operon